MEIYTILITIGFLIAIFLYLHLRYSLRKIVNENEEYRDVDAGTYLTSATGNKEVNKLVRTMNERNSQYRKKERAILEQNKQLQKTIINISHDLKTPLTSSIGYLEMLQKYDLPIEQKKEYEKIVIDKLEEVSQLIADFFAFTKLINEDAEIEIEEVDMNRIFQESVISYYQDFSAQNRKVEIQGSQKITYMSNERMLRRIFDNVIINALKHGEGDLTVTISVEKTIRFCFSNPTATIVDVEKIFEEFYTSDMSRTKQNTGLGLAIVKEFAQRLGGQVEAQYQEGMFHIIITFLNKR